ncbi:MAG: phage head-tail connector protein [Novosphingobium sp.]|uniref:head-tail connector protein n=1 Tax=Novosphingobium sp. TaxID=1874826 RepID=UPI00262F6BE2|nr:hypothetical protein [Novosphingobium sp.]MCP5385951.1 phage head-tail connector protein [Novosphingobium sp.]
MRQGTIVTVKPDGHPLSVFEAKRQLRIEPEDTDQDDHIADLCAAAHRKIERDLGFPILRQTLETHLTGFPRGSIWLGGGDSPEIVAIRYRDTTNAVQTLDPAKYVLDAASRLIRVYPALPVTWPATACTPGAVVVQWRAGWEQPSDVDEDLIHAMKLLVGHWDQNREAVVVGTISTEVQIALDDILAPLRIPFIA